MIDLRNKNEEVESKHQAYRLSQCNNERRVLQQLNHPNIVKFVGSNEYPLNVFNLLMEHCVRNISSIMYYYYLDGDLKSYIHNRKNTKDYFSELHCCIILQQIAKGLNYAYAHSNDKNICIHRDIKPQNVLIYAYNQFAENQIHVKVCDFGSAKVLCQEGKLMCTKTGTQPYMSPELYKGEFYTAMADIWSFGILAIELANLSVVYNTLDQMDIERLIHAQTKPILPHYSKYFKELIGNMTRKIPQQRIKFSLIICIYIYIYYIYIYI